MRPGPPPEPKVLKLLKGNPGRRRLRNEPEPTIPPTCPEPPSFITGYAADLWWETAPELHRLGLLTRIAAETLAKMQANDPVMNAQIIKTKYGDAVMNPLVSIARKHAADMVRYANEFGLTSAARARLSAAGYAPPSSGKFSGLLSDGGTVVPMKRDDG